MHFQFHTSARLVISRMYRNLSPSLRAPHLGWFSVVVNIIITIITTVDCNDDVPNQVSNLDFEAIQDKVSDLKRIILDGLESIKEDALADEHVGTGRTIARLVDNAIATVNEACEIIGGEIRDKSLTKISARTQIHKVERELLNLKSRVVKEIQNLNSNTVVRIINKAITCYQTVVKVVHELDDLLDN